MFLGLDFGSSSARACVIDASGAIIHQARYAFVDTPNQTPEDWREALHALLRLIPATILSQLQRIAIDATSASVLLCDVDLHPVSPALLYYDARALTQAEYLKTIAPIDHIVCNASSGLAKFLWLTQHQDLSNAVYFMHQSDWLSALLCGHGGTSDYHNALKTGYDVEKLCWPNWVSTLPHAHLLPAVLVPGNVVSEITPALATHFNINPKCTVHAGTTDSIAAFIATGVSLAGAAVSSLGTTMVLKLLSTTRVESAQHGVYSHRYGDLWLAGGASNAGGGALKQFFSNEQLDTLSRQIDASSDSALDYYPLPRTGERFPYNDPHLKPRLTPRPSDDVQFLHGILQGLSRIEATGYDKLVELGAPPLEYVKTCGGGANNLAWQQLRIRLLGVSVSAAQHGEAAYGAALLAMRAGIIQG